MQVVELTAKSVDEARATAASRFGVSPETVQITVIEELKGLFGKSSVKVKAEAPEVAVATPEPAPVAAAPAPAPAVVEAPTPAEPLEALQEAMDEPLPVDAEAAADERTLDRPEAVATEEDAERLLTLTQEILASGELEIDAHSALAGGRYVNVELDGKDFAYLVGKHGEVLNALQYIVNIAAARRYANGVRVTLDGNNYRTKREAALTDLATQIAEQVRARREEAVLDALPAFERRIVHKVLAEIEGVETYSEGEEPNRRVVIAPAE